MKISEAVKPISYFKSHASEIVRDVVENCNTVIITLNGEAKAVLLDIKEYESNQESLALLKILAQSKKSAEEGKYKPAREVLKEVKKRTAKIKQK